jgi:hypothetical protein
MMPQNGFTPWSFNLATYNARTLCTKKPGDDPKSGKQTMKQVLDEGKLFQLETGCSTYNIDLIAIQETRFTTTLEVDIIDRENGMLFLTSASKLGHGGIGIYLSGKIKDHYLSKEKVSDRILVVRLDSHQSYPQVVGRNHYYEETNENGIRLVSMNQHVNLRLVQSRFPHSRLWTWKHMNGASRAQIDYIMISGKWVNSVSNCRAYNKFNLESDHRMLSAAIKLSLRTVSRPKTAPKPNWLAFDDKRTRSIFNLELKNSIKALSETNASFQSSYDALLECVEAVATTTLGITKRHKAKPWISDSTSELLERRDEAMNIFLASSKQDKQRAAKKNNYERLAKGRRGRRDQVTRRGAEKHRRHHSS